MDQVCAQGFDHVIFCSYPKAQYLARKDEIDAAIAAVLEKGAYVLGQEVEDFEQEFAQFCGTSYAIGVNSGTDALILSLKGFNIGVGDEVITTSHTALATNAAILAAGATPVLIDISEHTFNIDVSQLSLAYSEKTKAIIPVHLYGQPANMDAVLAFARENKLKVIEDCAQATGAIYNGRRVGSLGDAGCFSFYPTKNLGCLGDGGMIISNDSSFSSRVNRMRQYGWDEKRCSEEPGVNSRLDEIQAAVLRVKLPYLDDDNTKRRQIACEYSAALRGVELELPHVEKDLDHVFHLYVVKANKRDRLLSHLREKGIGASIHYPVPTHLEAGYKENIRLCGSLPKTESVVQSIITLPIYPELTQDKLGQVIKSIEGFF